MAKVLNAEYFTISEEIGSFNSSLFIYPYFYVLKNTNIYRLNVISKQFELIKVIDTLPSGENCYGEIVCSNTLKMYFVTYKKGTDNWGDNNDIYLYSIDVDSFEISKLYTIDSVYGMSGSGFTSICGKVSFKDGNLLHLYGRKTSNQIGGTGWYLMLYKVYDIDNNLNIIFDGSSSTIRQGTTSTIPIDGTIPYVTDNEYRHFAYGVYSPSLSYVNKCGFVTVENPDSNDTLDSDNFVKTGAFEFDNKIYIIGGVKNSNANTDLIVVDKDTYISSKIGDTTNNSKNQPIIHIHDDVVYVLFDSGSLGIIKYVEYNLKFSFVDRYGSVLAEINNKAPISKIVLTNDNNNISAELTFINLDEETVFYTLPEYDDYTFIGLSNRQLSKEAMIVAGENTVSINHDFTFYPVYKPYRIPSTTFDITLYQNTADNDRVDKTSYLNSVGEISGVLRDTFSITSPAIIIERQIIDFNYVFIPIFNRYYYVTDIVSVRKNLWEISLSVDVLMSYKDGISSLNAFIERNENTFNDEIVDNKRVIEQGYDIETHTIQNEVFNGQFSYILTAFGCKLR